MAEFRIGTLVAALVTIAVAPTFAQQATTAPTTLLRGVVVTANDVPLPRVRVVEVPVSQQIAVSFVSAPAGRGVLTDDRGQFTIRVPATESIRLSFTKARYTASTADIPLRERAPQASDIRVRMSLAGAISGQVLNRSGAPLPEATVALGRAGAPRSDSPMVITRTNDLGEYRFGGLAGGRYAVRAAPSMFALGADIGDRQAIVDAAAAEAPAINVSAGIEVGNISLMIDPPSEVDQGAARRPDSDPEATASLSGRVVNSDGTPIARAVVHAYLPYVTGRQVETDERGRFQIDRLRPGEYTVKARKYGFNDEQYSLDRTASPDRRVVVQKGQVVGSVDVMLTRGSAIAGTIIDEFGEPAQDVVVGALQVQVVAGRTQGLRAAGGARTDDRGQYRVYGLPPGTYVVQAMVGDSLAGASGYLPRFYPGTFSIDRATPTRVDFGAAVTGLDLTLLPTPAHRVTGVGIDSSGRPARGEALLAASARSGATEPEIVRTAIGADGSFEFTSVAPGDYVVQINRAIAAKGSDGRTITQEFGTSFVTVTAADPPPVQLRLAPGATLVGRVRYEGVSPGPSPILDLSARSADRDRGPLRGLANSASVRSDGSFEFRGVFGPTLLQARPQRNDWYLKSVVFEGQDITDTPFEFDSGRTASDIQVLISAFGATATGRATDDRAAPVRDYAVLLFSSVRDRWFTGSRWVKTERPSADGTFVVTGLPPGDYWVAAIDRVNGQVGRTPAPEPDLLEWLSSRAVRITLGEGQSQDLTLRVIRR